MMDAEKFFCVRGTVQGGLFLLFATEAQEVGAIGAHMVPCIGDSMVPYCVVNMARAVRCAVRYEP